MLHMKAYCEGLLYFTCFKDKEPDIGSAIIENVHTFNVNQISLGLFF